MSSLVVLACPPGPLTAVGDALADWSATQQLRPFLWVETSAWTAEATPPRGQTPALLVQAGRSTGTTLETMLTSQRFDRVRLVVLVPALAGAPGIPGTVEHHIHQAVLGTAAVGQIDLIRMVVTRPDSGPVAAELAREGWHNLVIAPEASRGPGLGLSVLPATTDPIVIAPDAAACVAGVSGLWRDLDAGPLDGTAPPFGRTLRLVRSYYRDLDATAVSDHVRTGLLSLDDGAPLPRQHGTQAVYIDDAAMAASDMADAVFGRHRSLLRGERIAPAAVATERIGAWQALKLLFGFIGASVRMAPLKWYSLVIGDLGSAAADRVHRLVFGSDPSSYAVVAQGQLATGNADWRRVGQASASLDQALEQSGPRAHEIAGDFSAVWEDYVSSGMTLVDAGERGRAMPIQVGTERGVLRRMSDCVPGPGEAFPVPPRVAAATGIRDVRAADPLGQHTFEARVRQLGGQRALARDAEKALREFGAWRQRHESSYAARSGGIIARLMMGTSQEVQQLMATMADGAEGGLDNAEAQARQQRIATWMRTLLFTFLGLAVVLAVSSGVGLLTWWAALAAGGAGLLVWFAGSFILFAQGQRELFRDLNRQRAQLSQAEADQQNLRTAMRDLHRQSEAYGQFLEWTRVLGVVLHAPFGDTAKPGPDHGTIAAGLPLNARVGRAEVDADATAEVVSLMRRDLFQTGWLSGPWHSTLADAGARLGPHARDLTMDPRRMYAQRAAVSESHLTTWADELERGGVGNAAGDQIWRFALQRLAQPDYRSMLVSRVVLPGGNAPEAPGVTLSSEEFMAGVGEQHHHRGKFDGGVLVREARLEGRDGVVQAWPLERAEGLDRRAVQVELGEGLPEYTFDSGGRVPVSVPEDSAPSLVPPDPFGSHACSAAPGPREGRSDRSADDPPVSGKPVSAPGDGWVF